MNEIINKLALAVPGFLLAIVLHEAGHAYVADRFGDDTAKRQGRLSLNPVVHADLIGTVIFPLIGIAMGGIPFGWAKPVPVDTRNFKNIRHGVFWVSFAGPAANIFLAIISAITFAVFYVFMPNTFEFKTILIGMAQYSVFINILLAVFNLIPFPPLDGSKMVTSFLDYNQARKFEELQRYSFVFILILWFTPIFGYIFKPFMLCGYWLMDTLVGFLA